MTSNHNIVPFIFPISVRHSLCNWINVCACVFASEKCLYSFVFFVWNRLCTNFSVSILLWIFFFILLLSFLLASFFDSRVRERESVCIYTFVCVVIDCVYAVHIVYGAHDEWMMMMILFFTLSRCNANENCVNTIFIRLNKRPGDRAPIPKNYATKSIRSTQFKILPFTICVRYVYFTLCQCVWARVYLQLFLVYTNRIDAWQQRRNTRSFWCICLSFRCVLSFSVVVIFGSLLLLHSSISRFSDASDGRSIQSVRFVETMLGTNR